MGKLQQIEQLIQEKQKQLRPAREQAKGLQARRELLEAEVLAAQKEPARVTEVIEKQEEIARLTQTLLRIRPIIDEGQKEIVELTEMRDWVKGNIVLETAKSEKGRRALEKHRRNFNQAAIREAEKVIADSQLRLRQLAGTN